MSSSWDRFLSGFDPPEPEPDVDATGLRPFHDGRHSSITHAAAAGVGVAPLQASAGHSDISTTQRYIHLAGVLFRDEAHAAEGRVFGSSLEVGSTNG